MFAFDKILCLTFTLLLSGLISAGQDKSVYNEMSLDEILDIDVAISASKKPEDLFETPLSVTIIKKEEIIKAGATSIPEALRLAPGLIVREITPGNFDVHIRGYDDITKNAYLTLPFNTTTLVMIDNRIVYSYFTGGTFWEALPIDVHDVEQIEVVRGPASALYGPNAFTGVINIITSRSDKNGLNVFAKANYGNNRAANANTSIAYNWNNNTSLTFSGNYTERHRYDIEYFDYTSQSYTSLDKQHVLLGAEKNISTHENWEFKDFQEELGAYYNEDLSLQKMGGNIFFNHKFSEITDIDIAIGAQKSQSIKTGFLNFVTPLSQLNSTSYYLNSRFKHNNLSGQFNVNSGEDLSNYNFNSYKFRNIEANFEYYKQFNKFSIRPGFSLKHSTYNSPITYSEPFELLKLNDDFTDEDRNMYSHALSLLSEWKPNSKLRIIGAVRADKFDINNNISVNYELATTYRLNKNNLIRFAYSKADRSPFIFDTYLNCKFNMNMLYDEEINESLITVPVETNILANDDLDFPEIRNTELGWRTKITQKIELDLEAFHSYSTNFIVSNVYREAKVLQQLYPTSELEDSIKSIVGKSDIRFENFDIEARQIGASFTLNFNPSERLYFKLFGTYQKTILYGKTETEYFVTKLRFLPVNEERIRQMNVNSFTNSTRYSKKLTPSFYGGFDLNYQPHFRWNINTNAYFYTNQRFIDYDYNSMMSDYSNHFTDYYMDINGNLVWNAKVMYKIHKHTTTFINLKNILGKHREFGYADQIGSLFLVGIQWKL